MVVVVVVVVVVVGGVRRVEGVYVSRAPLVLTVSPQFVESSDVTTPVQNPESLSLSATSTLAADGSARS